MKFTHYIFRFFAIVIAKTPFFIVHVFSNVLTFVFYRLVRYRRDVVRENLVNSFPEKETREIDIIEKRFYKHLVDIILEILKVTGMTKSDLRSRVSFKNKEVLDRLYDENRSVFLMTGHIGNWEWAGSMIGLNCGFKGVGIAKPLSDPYFDHFMTEKVRKRFFPLDMLASNQTFRELIRRRNEVLSVFIVADQTPMASEINFWTPFLNQETGFFLGVEKMSKSLDYAVVYMDTRKKGRSRYEICFTVITEDAKSTEEREITTRYAQLLERSIINQPENWLWSHRRWKHKRNNNSKTDKHIAKSSCSNTQL